MKSFRTILLLAFLAFTFLVYLLYTTRLQQTDNLELDMASNKYLLSTSSSQKSSNNEVYTIVIDAGSTGSRIHVFRLKHDKGVFSDKFDAELIKEDLFVKVTPGLSSYSHSPEEASQSIKPLLDKALDVIPKEKHGLTYLTLKATAGLRLISDEIADKILASIRKLFDRYPFQTKSNDPEILDGKFEGIYSWLTLNYALDTFKNTNESSVCSMDLGGGSTQITFIPTDKVSLQTFSKDSIVEFKLDDVEYNIYSKSFLGFGLNSARLSIFKSDLLNFNTAAKNDTLASACLAPNHESKWKQQGVEYTILGPKEAKQHSFDTCYKSVLQIIENKLNAPAEVRNKQIFAFSFFFDILKKAGIIQNDEGHPVEINAIKQKTETFCNPNHKSSSEEPFMCLDMTYIYAILTRGYGLPDEKIVNVHQKVNNMEISWALGAAFDMID